MVYHRVDLRDQDALASLLKTIPCPDVLVCVAALVNAKPVSQLEAKDIRSSLGANMLSHAQIMATFLPEMYRRNRGQIVTVASIASFISGPNNADYAASKFALRGWHEGLRMEIKRDHKNIWTTIIHPYIINTTLFEGITSRMQLYLPELYTG